MSAPAILAFTPIEEIEQLHAELRASFASGRSRPIPYRKEQLAGLAYLLKDNMAGFKDALAHDLGRPHHETEFMETNFVIKEVLFARENVEKWSKPTKPPFNMTWSAMRPQVRKEPKGVALIISPFNFPLMLSLVPLAGAIAAGNAAVLKPSELIPHTSALLAELFPKYLDPTMYRCVNGAIPETTKLLELKWDHILYTGNGRVAKIVSAAAAKHLTPVSLELGGKSPVIVDPKCDVASAAHRILWGKTSNAGQVCLAPDYILVPREFQPTLVAELEKAYKEFYPDGAAQSDSLSRIVTDGHWRRVKGLLDRTKGTVVIGGESDQATRFIAPTIIKDVATDDSLMSEEIFGPLLPIVPVKDIDEAIAYVNSNDHPLAVYVFSQDAAVKAKVFDNTQSGSCVANETLIQVSVDGLPFGGVGPSGTGAYTGKFGFDMFTHARSSLDSPTWVDFIMNARFPPYTAAKRRKLAGALKTPPMPPRPGQAANTHSAGALRLGAVVAALITVVGVLAQRGHLKGITG